MREYIVVCTMYSTVLFEYQYCIYFGKPLYTSRPVGSRARATDALHGACRKMHEFLNKVRDRRTRTDSSIAGASWRRVSPAVGRFVHMAPHSSRQCVLAVDWPTLGNDGSVRRTAAGCERAPVRMRSEARHYRCRCSRIDYRGRWAQAAATVARTETRRCCFATHT